MIIFTFFEDNPFSTSSFNIAFLIIISSLPPALGRLKYHPYHIHAKLDNSTLVHFHVHTRKTSYYDLYLDRLLEHYVLRTFSIENNMIGNIKIILLFMYLQRYIGDIWLISLYRNNCPKRVLLHKFQDFTKSVTSKYLGIHMVISLTIKLLKRFDHYIICLFFIP